MGGVSLLPLVPASIYDWAKGIWLRLSAAVGAPYAILAAIDFHSPNLFTEDVRTCLGCLALTVIVLVVVHYHIFVWTHGITLDEPWTTRSWGRPMMQNPAIRLGEKGDASVSFRLSHVKSDKEWVIQTVVDEGAVIQDYGPKKRTDSKIHFQPVLDELGTHAYLCVSGQASLTQNTSHLVTLKLSDDSRSPGSHIRFRAKVGKRIASKEANARCRTCKGRNCSVKAMRTIIDFKALVVPPEWE